MPQDDIIQRMARGELTADERAGYSENTRGYVEHQPKPNKVSFKLTKAQKLAIFQDIKFKVVDGMTSDEIGRSVVACIDEHLAEKESEAYGKSLKKGVIRRVE